MNKTFLSIMLIIFICVGAMQITVFIHEGIHVIQFDEVEKICYDFNMTGDGGYMSVTGKHLATKDTSHWELWAYGVQSIILGIFLFIIFLILKKWGDETK